MSNYAVIYYDLLDYADIDLANISVLLKAEVIKYVFLDLNYFLCKKIKFT